MAVPKFLSNIGHIFKVIFANPKSIAVEAGIADILLPGFRTLTDSAASSIINAEAAASAAGVQNGTGAQKLEYAAAAFTTTYNQWAAQNKLAQVPGAAQAVTQKVFDLMTLLNELMVPVSGSVPVLAPAPAPPTSEPVSVQPPVAAVPVA